MLSFLLLDVITTVLIKVIMLSIIFLINTSKEDKEKENNRIMKNKSQRVSIIKSWLVSMGHKKRLDQLHETLSDEIKRERKRRKELPFIRPKEY